jgi:outer membrane protein assembly factor BamE (lipoprotein component of BamABCDE complex)
MFFVGMVTVTAVSCSSDTFVSYTGNMPSEEKISELSVGQTKQQIAQVLGSPSSVVSLDRDTWIYMSSEIKQVAFLKPEEIDRKLLVLKFDESNKVIDIRRYNKEYGGELVISEEATAEQEQEQSFFRKYFGGVGQYMPIGGNRPNNL